MKFSTFKNIILVGLIILLGIWLVHLKFNFFDWNNKRQTKEKAAVLVEKIKEVAKLITVEGYFSEVYSYDDFYWYDITPFRKKILIRVNAKVSMGYDFDSILIKSIPEEKKIIISNIPEINVLSIDHDLDYFDIQEGVFNHFDEKDLTKVSANAKEFIRAKVLESELKNKAELQGSNMFNFIKSIVDSQGWTVEIVEHSENPVFID